MLFQSRCYTFISRVVHLCVGWPFPSPVQVAYALLPRAQSAAFSAPHILLTSSDWVLNSLRWSRHSITIQHYFTAIVVRPLYTKVKYNHTTTTANNCDAGPCAAESIFANKPLAYNSYETGTPTVSFGVVLFDRQPSRTYFLLAWSLKMCGWPTGHGVPNDLLLTSSMHKNQDALPDSLVGWESDTHPHTSPHRRLGRLDLGAGGASLLT